MLKYSRILFLCYSYFRQIDGSMRIAKNAEEYIYSEILLGFYIQSFKRIRNRNIIAIIHVEVSTTRILIEKQVESN